MRWKAAIWLGIALATVACEHLTIDRDIHLPGSNNNGEPPENHVQSNSDSEDRSPSDDNSDTGLDSDGHGEGLDSTEIAGPSVETEKDNEGSKEEEKESEGGESVDSQSNESTETDTEGPDEPGDSEIEEDSETSKEEEKESEGGESVDSQSNESTETDTEGPDEPGDSEIEEDSETSKEEEKESEGGESVDSHPNESTETDTEGPDEPEQISPEDPESEEVVIEITRTVQTDAGKVSGFYTHAGTTKIENFIDIPYGAFTGLFSAPTDPPPWPNVRHRNEHSTRCPQLQGDQYVGEVDCLTLSVFVPHNATNAKVLFHIHESNFVSGSGDPAIYGPEYLVSKGVILVLPNYRLGSLGFLCLHNHLAPGNAALKDLTLALRWTQRYIEEFGGDPSNIVVSGDGSSGALVGYLTVSPKSRDYIKGAITESGSVLSHWALDRDPTAAARSVARIIRPHSRNVMRVYEDIEIHALLKSSRNARFKPCIETDNGTDAFLNETPWTIMHDEEWETNIAFMIGSANHAGMHEALDHTAESLSELNEDFSAFLPNDLKFKTARERTEVGERVKEKYFGESSVSLQQMEQLSECYTDAEYLGPAIRTARPLVDAGATVYLYEFSFVGELNREHHLLTDPVQGAARGDIIGYIFTQGGVTPVADSDEGRMVDLMTDLWVTFINTGRPSAADIEWNELEKEEDSGDEQWLSIAGPEDVTLTNGLHVERLQLWTEIYEEHFVENLALGLEPHLYPVFLSLIFLLVFYKESLF